MNKRDRKVAKQTVLWMKKGYNLHKRGDKNKVAAYSRKYGRIMDYRMFGNHTPSEQARLDRESEIRFYITMDRKYDKYWYGPGVCKGCNASQDTICI
jgi:hypothetical protein